ncbi:OmpA-OmpF porin, OOP family [Fibrella aestuarina BUZ 2]|uniref:OmpA-OmpF porin, OOP family n=1 Tax=Fibrella aestuarina BUZ 2 TaxID=1166018 RepID=I0KEE7_9BACT|nr:OmpA family protein [Fibrella aestuarina]CCH02500.1 OmpA-OmpF porin, OOP family [Fibrella aestuarina BUZ 2]
MFTNKTPWIVLLLLWMGGSTWWHVCKIKQLCGDSPPSATAPVAAASAVMPSLIVVDGDKLNWNVPGNFSFAKSGAVASEAAVGNTLQTVADYLKANPGRVLTLTGYYHADEQNTTTLANLGVARAEGIKAKLVALGVPAAQLATRGVQATDTNQMPYNTPGDSLYGGLAFAFDGLKTEAAQADTTVAEKPKTEEALAEAQKFTSVFEPIDLYFKLGQSNYIQTEDTKKFFKEAEAYLKEHTDKKLVLTGHTDDRGPEGVNLELSKARASTVKNRLTRAGIKTDQIEVNAKGETEPKESNATLEGRKANRRVTVVVQ